MTAPRRATVVRRMLPPPGQARGGVGEGDTSSALCTGAEVAKASYQPPAALGPTAETDATAHTGRAELLWRRPLGPLRAMGQNTDLQGRPGPQPPNAEPAQHLRARAPRTETPASRTRNARTAPPRPLRACASNPGVEWADPAGNTVDLPGQASDVLSRTRDDARGRKVPPFPRGTEQAYCADTKLSRCRGGAPRG